MDKIKVNVYDFDKTIYNGDSSVDFYLFCLKEKKKIIFLLPKQILGIILYKLKIYSKEKMKSNFFCFLKYINSEELVSRFWDKNSNKILDWYIKQKSESDLIISASPQFLLTPICEKLNVNLIASIVDQRSGKFLELNCYGQEKLNRMKKLYPEIEIDKFYSDSKSDKYLADVAVNAFLVKKAQIRKWHE